MNGAGQSAKRLSRADLLRVLVQLGDHALESVAETSGYVPLVRQKVQLKLPLFKEELKKPLKPKFNNEKPLKNYPQAVYYYITDRKGSDIFPKPANGEILPKPEWYQKAERLNPDAMQLSLKKPPNKEPLAPWSRLWPVLQSMLSDTKVARQPDIPRIVKTIANGIWMQKIPRKTRQRWAATAQVLVDRTERTCLFNHDYNQLLNQLEKLRGGTGLVIQKILQQPGGNVQIIQGKTISIKQWQVPVAGTAVFILSDLGLLDRSGIALHAWLRLGYQLHLAGCRPVALVPLPERYLTPDLISLFDCICWDRGSQLLPVTYVAPQDVAVETPLQRDVKGAEQLLAWLSPAMRVEPALLRAVRHRLPLSEIDIGHEVAAWHHDDVVPTQLGFYYQTSTLKQYRQQFEAMAEKNPQLAKIITRLIRNYHRHVFQTQRDEELLILAQLMGKNLDAEDMAEVESARQAMCELVKASFEQGQDIPSLSSFLENLVDRQHDEVLTDNACYQAVRVNRLNKQDKNREVDIPKEWDWPTVVSFLETETSKRQRYVLFQQGVKELKLCANEQFQQENDGFQVGSALAEFETSSVYILRQHSGPFIDSKNTLLPLNQANASYALNLNKGEEQKLHIAGEEITIACITQPDWAVLIGKDKGGLYAESMDTKGDIYRWYWHPPEWRPGEGMLPGFWFYIPVFEGAARKPDWAIDAGRDQYGFYADMAILKTIQRFRWIEPASFMMGSPKDEDGRYDNETQHQVNLSQGYWLADTSCTQELWQAVMRDNPSQFKEPFRPVETVRWDDVQRFIKQISKQNPESKLRLPTEAEWENACRAGTETAFYFGSDITLEQVNYRGTWEFDPEKWGKGALQQTASVKSYPPNAWGLYEMHGNVWEWCQDRYGDYPSESVTDPQGPKSGVRRVVRGGSWNDYGRYVRSAYRRWYDPDVRLSNLGFRLARGHELKPARTVRAGQQPVGSRAGGAHGGQTGDGLRSRDKLKTR